MLKLRDYIRDIPDFPKKGVVFKDITTALKDPELLAEIIINLSSHYEKEVPDKIVGIESRGFILGPAIAKELGAGFVPARKGGKLPSKTASQEYNTEYSTDVLEIHEDAIEKNERVLIVDDLLATGGTAQATAKIVEQLEGQVVGFAFMLELSFLKGREKIGDYPIKVLEQF
ncbi:adenine phosphoribosyltransferase [Natranaerobius thermophilus]|uniref:Adenine phosphoribosyltransferase n=1 Tax=Natranaerobius thermophilus (strain ATCC BAA-1301 / DSM 18059 / JW/NM-WN-LF) TaxID=457570 RepID=APT_NATTJ|nr:RecName: Full=Adenine phosphoribosyltransferase; Short=APRT [Natranaerobius thermophilus JW/NM-WN-LF]ACB84531.1 adenine phosphoribosyltransferase [Natranaerobius thermophilus JW/NM-WN-LF]